MIQESLCQNLYGFGNATFIASHLKMSSSVCRIIRAPDRDLYHFYHEKYCDPNLKWDQYKSCLGSKAKTEGTPAQIAIQLTRLREKYEGFSERND